MAGANTQFGNLSSLSSDQQDLLLAALSSNNPNGAKASTPGAAQASDKPPQVDRSFSFDTMDSSTSLNGQTNVPLGNFGSPFGAVDESPYLDFLDGTDPNFDFDYEGEDGQMIGDLPGADELHDKRKNPDDDKEDNENGGKRREGEDKTAKKPGRKPLTSEPTNKRKAQNRAAQRAFRERKEKHLKDLETKVGELEKASESANHENGLLRAQVDRMQVELREYRKRLSLNDTSSLSRSPPMGNGLSFMANPASTNTPNDFQFEFPRFGSLPGSVFHNGVLPKNASPAAVSATSPPHKNRAPGVLARDDSTGPSVSPRSQSQAKGSFSSAGSPADNSSNTSINGGQSQQVTNDNLSALFSSPIMNGFGNATDFNSFLPNTTAEPQSMNYDNQSQSGQSRIFQFNSNSVSSESPESSSSVSQYGATSSCGTSPEPSHNSPSSGNKDATLDTINESNGEGEVTFCEKLNMACGNIRDPVPRAATRSNGTPGAPSTATPVLTSIDVSSNDPLKNFDWLANQNGGQFDPVLFGDYREPQNAIVGDGDFTGGFFNDAMPTMDFNSPFNWADLTAPTGLTPAIQKSNPLEQADALQAGLDVDEVVPGEDTNKLLSCSKIWDKLQDRQDFLDGSLDIDGLCSELRSKARCSESGVVIDQKDVDGALQRLPANGSGSNSGLTSSFSGM